MKKSESANKSTRNPVQKEGVHLAPLMMLRNAINQDFDRFLSRFGATAVATSANPIGSYNPNVNVSEANGWVRVQVELPGVSPDEVSVIAEGLVLTIQGERKRESGMNDAEMYRREFGYGPFRRSITLPGEVAADKSRAGFRKGILTIELPMTARTPSERKAIPIHGE